MALLTDLLEGLADLPQPAVLAVTGGLTLAECTIGVGFIAPGESALLLAATTATTVPRFVVMWLVVSLCAIAGDSIGYFLGRRYGDRLRDSKVVRKLGQEHWDRAGALLRRRGAWAVFFARFMPVVRTLVPASAGASRLEYRRFLPASIAGAMGWSALHIGIGSAAGASAKMIESTFNGAMWVLMGVAAVVGLVVFLRRRNRRRAQVRPRELEEV
ncbi:DedA family protein [Saccharothrix violaceirubra]|uniref:Membrane protein DedA with SNARE-associated domain n=1 Tax=Saccharothrix violaceirubra TaxID=413306 RepID=A0A7W7T095_9PSEU|nr:DedA family protein [Saccharothrix violaceirubra]MBB4964194.1 membrane protein DedA with SNARE-associated domain [Saccharothrix violaceirubra]